MSNCVSFHTQLASIMEVLANAAVAEICKLVDDGYAVLRLEISESRKENKALKRKLQMMELRVARGGADRGAARDGSANSLRDRTKVCDTAQQPTRDEAHFQAAERVFGKLVDTGPRRGGDANLSAVDEDASPANPVITWDECADMEEGRSESVPVKEERVEEDGDPQRGLKFPGQRTVDLDADGGKRDPTVDTQSRPAQHTEELTEQHRTRHSAWEVSGLENVLKAEPENDSVNKRLQHRGSEHRAGGLNSLGSESVMCEGTSHLGTLFSQEDGETEADDPACLYSTETDSEGMSALSEPQPGPATEEGSGNSVSSLSSVDWKTDVVIIDSVPIKEEAEMRTTWHKETFSEVAQPTLRHYSNHRERGEVQAEILIKTCPTETQMRVRPETTASNIIAPNVDEPAPCDKTFTASEYSDANAFRAGSREKRFFCSYCGKGFSCPKKVEIHQRVHTGEKPFSCAQCRKQFAQAGNLKRHQRVHTGEKPFSCTQCEKRFSHLHQLKMHQKVHTGERPYGCPHCGKRFAEKSYLRIHQQRNHTDVCSVR